MYMEDPTVALNPATLRPDKILLGYQLTGRQGCPKLST